MPTEVFADKMKMNLMGFHYCLSRYPYWTPPIHRLACIIVSEYTMRESIGCLEDYSLLPNETFHFTTDGPGEDIEDWLQIFLCLGRRLVTNRPLTLWADVFALQILYSMKQGVQVMFQPCYAEMRRIKPTTEHHQLRLHTISQLLMKDLNAYPLPYPERENGRYLIVPIYMLTHNPSVLQAKTSMIPNYTNLERTQYQKEVFAELTSPHLPKPRCEIGPGHIYDDAEVCTECKLETQDLVQQLSAVENQMRLSKIIIILWLMIWVMKSGLESNGPPMIKK